VGLAGFVESFQSARHARHHALASDALSVSPEPTELVEALAPKNGANLGHRHSPQTNRLTLVIPNGRSPEESAFPFRPHGWPILNFALFAKFRVGMLDAGATSMKSPCAVNLHNAVTVSQQRLGKRVAQLSPARMNEVCVVLRFSLGYDSN